MSHSYERAKALERCRFLVQSGVWPQYARIHPEEWLNNFTPDEEEHALCLLRAFLYYPTSMINAMLTAVFQSLAGAIARHAGDLPLFRSKWHDLVHRSIFTYVSGENPNPTDSGYTFARKLRQELGIPEERILDHRDAIDLARDQNISLIFVDDFVGSGSQFNTTWNKQVPLDNGQSSSFREVADPAKVIYCNLICTESGKKSIADGADPQIEIATAHTLSTQYSVHGDRSNVWPPHLKESSLDFIARASDRAGIPEAERWGFSGLGLLVAFEHSVPDATIPLIHWEGDTWRPLVVRS